MIQQFEKGLKDELRFSDGSELLTRFAPASVSLPGRKTQRRRYSGYFQKSHKHKVSQTCSLNCLLPKHDLTFADELIIEAFSGVEKWSVTSLTCRTHPVTELQLEGQRRRFISGIQAVFLILRICTFYLLASFLDSANLCLSRNAATASATFRETQRSESHDRKLLTAAMTQH